MHVWKFAKTSRSVQSRTSCLKDVELRWLLPNTNPAFCKPRTVPYAILEDLNVSYDEGIKKGIWIPTHSTIMDSGGASTKGTLVVTESQVTDLRRLFSHCEFTVGDA